MDERTRELLQQPFDSALVKTRRGPNGKSLSYVEVSSYIVKLNEAFAHAWSFEIVGRERIGDEIIVEARLTAGGIIKTGVGGSSISRRRDGGEPVSVADDIKAASSDALKRCCRLLGLGAELYSDDRAQTDDHRGHYDRQGQRQRLDNASNDNNNGEDKGRVTVKQLSTLQRLVAETGSDWGSFREATRRQYGVNPEYADRKLGSKLIGDLIEEVRGSRSNGSGKNGGGANGGGGNGRYPSDPRTSW